MMGSYTGRMAPPGRPKRTSTSCISRLLMRAWAPVSFIAVPSLGSENETTSRLGGRGARGGLSGRACARSVLRGFGGRTSPAILAAARRENQPRRANNAALRASRLREVPNDVEDRVGVAREVE